MTDNVSILPIAKAMATPEEALAMASQKKWEKVIIIGYLEDGGKFHYVTSHTTRGEANYLLDVMKHEMICSCEAQ